MTSKLHSALLATTAFGLALAFCAPQAMAASSTNVQAEIAKLQKEIDELKAAQTQQAAETAKVAAAAKETEETTGKLGDKITKSIKDKTGVDVTFGGYADLTAINRTHNMGSDTGTAFASIPYNNSVNAHQSEFRLTARNSRFSVAANGNLSSTEKAGAYLETDFNATAYNSSPNQTNNYSLRLRQAFGTYENSEYGLHVLGGQAFSLATQNKDGGMLARNEALPMVLDAAFYTGYTYDRNAQIRIVKDFDKKVWLGLSVESPSSIIQGSYTGVGTNNSSGVSGMGTCTVSGSSATCTSTTSDDIAPDVVAKVGVDTGFGHYEVFGMGRTFHDRVTNTSTSNVFAPSGGANAYVPFLDKKIELTANFIGGKGVGRYVANQLGDYAYTSNGNIKPLTELAGSIGVVGHPTPTWDVFAYAGIEDILRYDTGTSTGGYANYTGSSYAGCETEGGTCTAATNYVWQITGGAWHSLYKGNMGKVQVGLQDSWTRKDAFRAADGYAPHASENVTMVSFRFSPTF